MKKILILVLVLPALLLWGGLVEAQDVARKESVTSETYEFSYGAMGVIAKYEITTYDDGGPATICNLRGVPITVQESDRSPEEGYDLNPGESAPFWPPVTILVLVGIGGDQKLWVPINSH